MSLVQHRFDHIHARYALNDIILKQLLETLQDDNRLSHVAEQYRKYNVTKGKHSTLQTFCQLIDVRDHLYRA